MARGLPPRSPTPSTRGQPGFGDASSTVGPRALPPLNPIPLITGVPSIDTINSVGTGTAAREMPPRSPTPVVMEIPSTDTFNTFGTVAVARGISFHRSPSPMIVGAPSNDTINTIGTSAFNNAIDRATEESVIVELTRRLSDREAELRTITEEKVTLEGLVHSHYHTATRQAGDVTIGADAYNMLLGHHMQREGEVQAALASNVELEKKIKALEKLVLVLQESSTLERRKVNEKDMLLTQMGKKVAKAEEESESHRCAIIAAEDVIKKKEGVIDFLNRERESLTQKVKASENIINKEKANMTVKINESEKVVNALKAEIAGYEELVTKSKTLATEQINVLLDNEKTIGGLEVRNATLEKEFVDMKEKLNINAHTIDSKDALLNMQRQELGRLEDLVQMYEVKFESKGRDIPKIVALADEGDRIWSKIEEREKFFEAKEAMYGVLREENTSLTNDKKRLQAEVDELKECFEACEIMLSGTKDKVHMPWLLAQLRDTVQLREKISELQDIIKGEGYTIKASDAEADFRAKEREINSEMEKLTEIIEILKGQTKSEKIDVPVLIGKLEECLVLFGEDIKQIKPFDDIMTQNVSAPSSVSDINQSMSLNTADNSYIDEKWVNSTCITPRDFKDLMLPRHYVVMSSLVDGFSTLKAEGLCHGEGDEEEEEDADVEDRTDIIDTTRAGGDERTDVSLDRQDVEEDCEDDIHIEKVLKVIAKNDVEVDDWRKWISPPNSPCSENTATDE